MDFKRIFTPFNGGWILIQKKGEIIGGVIEHLEVEDNMGSPRLLTKLRWSAKSSDEGRPHWTLYKPALLLPMEYNIYLYGRKLEIKPDGRLTTYSQFFRELTVFEEPTRGNILRSLLRGIN